ncbi:MAG: aldehyde dehydrogenase family protein [Candidatus Nanopelagicales bacterium]
MRQSATCDGRSPHGRPSLAQRIGLLNGLRRRLGEGAARFVEEYRSVHPVDPRGPWAVEPWGLQVVMAQTARVLERVLRKVEAGHPPVKRTWIRRRDDGRLAVRVFPMTWDERLLLSDYRAQAWLSPEVTVDEVIDAAPATYGDSPRPGGVTLLLAAGNAANLLVSDLLHLMFEQGCVVAVKMSPVLAFLRPHMETVFADFISGGWLRFVDESLEAGSYLAHHPGVDRLHMTGSAATHDALVWGTVDQAERKRSGSRLLDKPFTAELGGVTPVIVVPGPWSAADIRRQADLITFAKLFNCGHICGAAQVLVLPEGWPQGDALINEVRAFMRGLEPRPPYYPGTAAKVANVLSGHAEAEALQEQSRRILVENVDPAAETSIFSEEVFSDVLAVVRLPARNLRSYLDGAVEFVNGRLYGDLSANVLVDPATAKREAGLLDALIAGLSTGTVGVNEWAIMGSILGSAPWGGFPGNTPTDIGSGIGKVLNPLCLPMPEKSVLTGNFRPLMKPPRSVESRTAMTTYRRLLEYLTTDDPRRIPGVALAAARG